MNRRRSLDIRDGATMSRVGEPPRPEPQSRRERIVRSAIAFALCVIGAGMILWEVWGGSVSVGIGMGVAVAGAVVLVVGLAMTTSVGRAPGEVMDARRARALQTAMAREAERDLVGRSGHESVLVATDRAPGAALREHLTRLQTNSPSLRFTILVPAVPVGEGPSWTEDDATREALARGTALREELVRTGIRIAGVRVGDKSASMAILDELRSRRYGRVVVVADTEESAILGRFGLETVERIRPHVSGPIDHIVEQPAVHDR